MACGGESEADIGWVGPVEAERYPGDGGRGARRAIGRFGGWSTGPRAEAKERMKVKFFRGVPGEALQGQINTWLEATGARPQLTNTLWEPDSIRGETSADAPAVIVTVWYDEG